MDLSPGQITGYLWLDIRLLKTYAFQRVILLLLMKTANNRALLWCSAVMVRLECSGFMKLRMSREPLPFPTCWKAPLSLGRNGVNFSGTTSVPTERKQQAF